MPNLAVSASPIAVATPASSPVLAADGSALGQSLGAFAALLQQQMVNPALSADMANALAAAVSEEDPGTAPDGMLPLLMDSLAFATAGQVPVEQEPVLQSEDRRGDESAVSDLPVATALPIVASQSGTVTSPVASAPATASPAVASPTANLAAATDLAGGAAAKAASPDGAEFLPNTGRDAAALVAANPHSHSPAVSHANAQAVATPVGSAGWDAEVGNHMVWMAGQQTSRAELILTPPQMGRIEVSLTVTGDQATAQFVSASPAVREAIENAVPRLREILADAGITLGQTQIGAETPGQSAHGNESGDNSGGKAAAPGLSLSATPAPIVWTATGRGLVDVFA